MDFMKLVKSLEELLYEVMVMLVFFPKTLWLTICHPQRMMDYADTELGDVLNEQYKDTLSPPLFLMLCVGISYMAQRAAPAMSAETLLPAFLHDTQNLLAMRVLAFSLFPLLMALRLLHGLKEPLDRDTLRPPFFAQCFIAAPVAMTVGLGQATRHLALPHSSYAANALIILSLAWYLRQQAHWFRSKLAVSLIGGWWMAITTALLTLIIFFILAFLMLATT